MNKNKFVFEDQTLINKFKKPSLNVLKINLKLLRRN